MPIVSAFFGIIIRMYYRDHEPAHFHAEHQGQHATFMFDGEVLAGTIRSRTALRLIREWAKEHEAELARNWQKVKDGETLDHIAPLE